MSAGELLQPFCGAVGNLSDVSFANEPALRTKSAKFIGSFQYVKADRGQMLYCALGVVQVRKQETAARRGVGHKNTII